MKKKVLVTYSVKYIKEVELEINENIKWILEDGDVVIKEDFPTSYNFIIDNNKDILLDLPIPTLAEYESDINKKTFEEVEYIDDSFEIESFEL